MLSGVVVERPSTSAAEETYQSPPLSAPSEQTLMQVENGLAAEPPALGVVVTSGHVQEQHLSQVDLQLNDQNHLLPHLNLSPEAHLDALAEERIPLPERAWTLVEYYFAFTHAWLPMTDRQATLKLMYTYPRNGVLRFDAMNGEYAELWSILALAAAQIPNKDLNSESEHYRDVARSLIPSERTTYELGHVKAMIVLAVLEINRQQWMAAWMHVGLAVRVIVVLTSARIASGSVSQLHLEARTGEVAVHPALSAAEIKASQSQRFKHIGLSAFVLECAVASRIGAPSHLQPDQVNALGLLDEDGLEEWSPWHDPLSTGPPADVKAPVRSFSTLNQLVRLALRNESMGWTALGQATSTVLSTVVLRLVHNARQVDNRYQPATIVSRSGSIPRDHTAPTHGLQGVHHSGDVDHEQWEDTNHSEQHASPQLAQNPHHQLAYMSIPQTTESAFSGSPAVPGNPSASSGFWLGNGDGNSTHAAIDPQLETDGGSAVEGADLFEELAMLERTDSRQHPQFMANLGFAPDLDLAEFFGADYQPSDPMLAYMQPSLFNAASNVEQPPGNTG
ncbi:hypothetical protein LTR85_003173 [Meristemomyces frigidus]|nr:hypothetical protein LTR85_003173 [Meristemomyces frigidus]